MKLSSFLLALTCCALSQWAAAQSPSTKAVPQANITPTLSPATRPDLVVVRVHSPHRVPGQNGFDFKVDIENKGVLPADLKNVALQNYLTEEGEPNTPAGGGMLSTEPLSIKSGETKTFQRHFVYDFSKHKPAADGSKKLQLSIELHLDLHNIVDERDEENNQTQHSIVVGL